MEDVGLCRSDCIRGGLNLDGWGVGGDEDEDEVEDEDDEE